jgi:hypothetical protein
LFAGVWGAWTNGAAIWDRERLEQVICPARNFSPLTQLASIVE